MVADEAEKADLLSCISWLRFLHAYFQVHVHLGPGTGRHIHLNQKKSFR